MVGRRLLSEGELWLHQSFLCAPKKKKKCVSKNLIKNPPAMRETWVQTLGWEDPLEKGKATHSSILA